MKKRYSNYDLLRIICCIAVIIIHISATYKNALITQDQMALSKLNLDSKEMIVIFNILTRFAVPCFIMLSGAFLLSNNENGNYKKFYNKTIKKIVMPTIFFSLIFLGYSLIMNFASVLINDKELDVFVRSLKNFFTGNAYYHLWYMYVIIGLYILTPILLLFKNSISKKTFEKLSYIFIIWASISNWTSTYKLAWSIGKVFDFLGYFMLGNVIFEKNNSTKKSIKNVISYLIIGILLLLLLLPIQIDHINKGISESNEKYSLVESYNPLVLMSSVCIFIAFSQMEINYDFSKMANLTLYIYLFHAIIWDLLLKVLKILNIINEETRFIIVLIIGTILVYYISLLCSVIWIKIKDVTRNNNIIYKKVDKIFK